MPTLGNALDFAKYEARNIRGHQLGTAPSSPVTGQLYYNTADNTLYWWDNSQWISARGGATATPPATTGALGTIQLAGDLAGTATSPQIAPGVITDIDVATANKDGATNTHSMRSLGFTANQAMAGNVGIDINVRNNPPTLTVPLNAQRITGLGDPIATQDAATKQYVDNLAQGVDAKASVLAASTANVALFGSTLTIDGVGFGAGSQWQRVLLKNQTAPAENGIYSYNYNSASSYDLARASDTDAWTELPGAFVFVEQGTVNADTGWVCTVDQGGTLGTTAVTWTQFSGAGSINGGAGLLKTGNTLDVGQGAGITVNPDTIQVANNGITNAMIADGAIDLATADVTGTLPLTKGGTFATTATNARKNLSALSAYVVNGPSGSNTVILIQAVSHGFGQNVMNVHCTVAATGAEVLPDVVITPANGDVTITFGTVQASNSILVRLIGLSN